MEHVVLTDVTMPPTISPASVLKPLGRDLGTEHVAINYFELSPGDAFGFDYHRHGDQEEIFGILEGTATFATETGDVEVAGGEAIRCGPGEFQLGSNRGDRRVRAVALGGPRETTEIEYKRRCGHCAQDTIQGTAIDRAARVVTLTCQSCGGTVEEVPLS